MPEPIVSVDQDAIKDELKILVKATVEQTINGLLEERADELVGAQRYERGTVKNLSQKRLTP